MNDFKQIAESLMIKARIFQSDFQKSDPIDPWCENRRLHPIYSEWVGMLHALKILGIDYEIFYDEKVEKIISIAVGGEKA